MTPPRASPPEGGSLNGNTALSLLQHHLQLPQGTPRQYPESPSMSRCPWLGLGPTLWGRSDYWDLTTGVEKIERAEEIMEDIKKHPDPGFLLSLTMDTLTELSKMKPALPFNVKAAVLHVAVSGVDQLDPGTQEKMASFKKMLRGLLEDAPSIQDTIGILKELHKYINSEKPRLQTLGREAYTDALAHVARLPNVELATWKVFFHKAKELDHHDIQSTIKDGLVFEDFHEKEDLCLIAHLLPFLFNAPKARRIAA
ncbi:uncharacterized protein LOC128344336 isoform X2 [Hemicordylus capensis]|nr:uncharacterized protein LOC128344336 isoform X2 [Hemicordylus capensis]